MFAKENANSKIFGIDIARLFVPLIRKLQSRDKVATVMVFIAADNDLHIFAWKNIRQLAKISPANANIIVFLTEPGKHKKTQIYLIEKDRAYLLNKNNNQKQDSGDPETLINFCKFCISNYPAKDYVLVLWNHGTGILDPSRGKVVHPSELFTLNPDTLKLELDKTVPFLENAYDEETKRGICFDNTYGSYLNNQKLDYALKTIQTEALNGGKFSIIGLDACEMAMLEVANIFKKYSNILVSSQEVELGSGWKYDTALAPIATQEENLDAKFLANNMVESYKRAYEKIDSDCTLSAIDLTQIDKVEESLNKLSETLISCLKIEKNKSLTKILLASRIFRFDTSVYVDLFSVCNYILNNLDKIILNENKKELLDELKQNLANVMNATTECVIANEAGDNKKFARGISIYMPKDRIDQSYTKTTFASENSWYKFLTNLTQ